VAGLKSRESSVPGSARTTDRRSVPLELKNYSLSFADADLPTQPGIRLRLCVCCQSLAKQATGFQDELSAVGVFPDETVCFARVCLTFITGASGDHWEFSNSLTASTMKVGYTNG